jgi:predicted nucleotidyltransferase
MVMDEQVRAAILELLPQLRELGVTSLSVFGSASRSQLRPDSDVDFLVELEVDTVGRYFDVLFLLEDKLNRKVDLAFRETLHPLIRDRVVNEAVRVA